MPFFSYGNTIEQTNNAQLLSHLHIVKNTLQEQIEHIYPAQTDNEQAEFTFALNLINDFYSKSPALQKMVTDQINPCFELICNKMVSLEESLKAFPKQTDLSGLYIEPTFNENTTTELYSLFETVYAEHHKNYCENNPQGILVNVTANDIFREIIEVIHIGPKNLLVLLEKIENKIKELEA